ncbi:MAG: phosphoribosylformylglycinamidine synthase subunit PurQ [Acidobacteria bacterium]|nr:phosphoribosylformylglycinamidine synthase subunit PurQ [Acidobacteriota bacterium]
MKFAVVVFPGSNCDHDVYYVLKKVLNQGTIFVWHQSTDLCGADAVILPGGFSYGDYLRSGAVARFSPIMKAVEAFARKGGLVLGICNGLQILLESGLLPGAMLRNRSLKFVCREVGLRVENAETPFTRCLRVGDRLRIPVAHADGNYTADEETLRRLEGEGQIVLRYCDEEGRTVPESNPNGSARNIAGICNAQRNVLGMMPHPERCSEVVLGNDSGRAIFSSMIESLAQAAH